MNADSTSSGSDSAAELLAAEIRRLRADAKLSQPQLAQRIGYTRQYVSLAENSAKNLPSRELVDALDTALNAGGRLRGLREQAKRDQRDLRHAITTAPAATPATAGEVNSVVALGANPEEFLRQTSVETPVPTSVGWSDVERVRVTTRALAMSENMFGGGLSCEAAAGQLRWAAKLLNATAGNAVHEAMFAAVGNLSGVVAYAAFDVENYQAADRYFQFALWCADKGKSWPLRANTLAEMARKATYLGDHDGALTMIEFAQVRADKVTETARAMMCTVRARLLALTSRHTEALDEVTRADSYFAARSKDDDPPWLVYYDEAEHQGSTGKALIPVAEQRGQVALAGSRLEAAVRLHEDGYPRSRTFSRTRLASLTMAAGDPREAAMIGTQAVTEAVPLRSTRIVAELSGLARTAERHATIGEVAALRAGIATLVAPSKA